MTYFVKITNPKEFRRDILESSKKVIGCLQANRNVAYVREKKQQLIENLKKQVEELDMLVQKLDGILPDKHLREEAVQEAKRQQERLAEEHSAKEHALSPEEALHKLHIHPPEPPRTPPPGMPEKSDEEQELADAMKGIEEKLRSLH
ncbi:hypothetical protein GF367_00785 [Candidatus Woesearchaeota archaeon]|nr:hypothetical protein [Candidatus Woesearchaeota archaeon]